MKNLGASEVDAQTAQWVEAFANPAALPSSQGIQVASAPIGTVGDAGYSGAYIEPAQLIWADGTTSTLTHSSDGEPMLPEDFRRQEIEYRNSTEVQPPQYSFTELVEMSHSPVDSYSAQEYRDAAAQYRASMGEDFRRDSIYNGLWTRAAALDAAAGGGWGQEVMNDITGFATEEGLHAQTGVAIGGVLGRGIGNRLGGSVDNVVEAAGIGGVATNGALGEVRAIDDLLAAANKPYNTSSEQSVIARAWDKHSGRPGGTFEPLKGSAAEKNAASEAYLRDLLNNPGTMRTELSRGGFEYRLPNGQGVRFNADGSFNTLLDPRKP